MPDRITSRFGARTAARKVVEGVDLTGRTAIVTGGGSGIGVETARALALAGADVVLAVRRPEAAASVAQSIGETARRQVEVQPLDLSSFTSVRAFSERWGERPLSVLVNNAGVMACPLSQTEDGLEMQIGTNHFGHFLLATLLAPALERAAHSGRRSRVVALSSIGHRRSPVHFDDPFYRSRPYDKWEAYGQAKTANALFAVGFDARFAERGVNANAVHPGGIMTPLQRHLDREEMIAFGWIDEQGRVNERFKTPEQGASTSVWAAVGAELEGVGGLYLEDCNQAEPFDPERPMQGVMPYATDPASAERLWELSEATVRGA
ncbi:MAG: SDR family NAD(P)-dependent oxidoreductase [Caulobacteraceae bacterium]|nr:SDR family NAD(P)-dependent oxidoreductase [Caulobacteraceae bacterium]